MLIFCNNQMHKSWSTSFFPREITLAQFKELVKTVAPKYQKDKKLDSAEAAYDSMIEAITAHDPALHGTTVRCIVELYYITIHTNYMYMYITK